MVSKAQVWNLLCFSPFGQWTDFDIFTGGNVLLANGQSSGTAQPADVNVCDTLGLSLKCQHQASARQQNRLRGAEFQLYFLAKRKLCGIS